MEPEHIEIFFDPQLEQMAGSYTPDFSAFEDWSAHVAEAIKTGDMAGAVEMVQTEVKARVTDQVMHAFYPLLMYIADSENPRFAADIASYSAKLRVRDGWTGSTIAQKYGLSRTAVRQHIKKFCELFQLPIPDERDGEQNSKSNRHNTKLA